MEDMGANRQVLNDLRRLGVSISLDDFGTGYSSLGYLKRLPVDVLKTDRCFIKDLATEDDDAAIARAFVTLAHSLRMKVAAGGVETERPAARLTAMGCDEMQGYWLARPMPTTAATAW